MPKRQYRRKASSDGEDSDSEERFEEKKLCAALEDMRDLQKLRRKPAGLSVADLTVESEVKISEILNDPLKLKTGGMIDLKKIKSSDLNDVDIEDDIRQTFSKESHLRDEDEEMRKYVEEELRRRKGRRNSENIVKGASAPEDGGEQLFKLPEQLKKYQSKKTEEMLSNQMLCGIPEVDLGVDAKIRNIEETEAVKVKLLKEAIEKKKNLEEVTTFKQDIVKDLAKDYVQHSYYNIAETTHQGKGKNKDLERPRTEKTLVVGDDTPVWVQDRPENVTELKPTDRDAYERFKKRFWKPKNDRIDYF